MLTLQGQPASSAWETLYALHPPGTPMGPVEGRVTWLLDPPGRAATTARWLSYRETCAGIAANHPDNPMAQATLKAAEEVLAWREALPEHLQFWDLEERWPRCETRR